MYINFRTSVASDFLLKDKGNVLDVLFMIMYTYSTCSYKKGRKINKISLYLMFSSYYAKYYINIYTYIATNTKCPKIYRKSVLFKTN